MSKLKEFGKKVYRASTFQGSGKRKKKRPKVEPVMPDDVELRRAARKRAAVRFGKGGTGRQSTMLTSDS